MTKMPTKKPKQSAAASPYVTRSEPFAATIIEGPEGKNVLAVASKIWYQHQLNKFKPGTKVTLELHTRKPKRTDSQNRYYWGAFLPEIAKQTGEHDLDALHELFKGKFLSEGVVEVLGMKVRKKKSTTELGVGEFSEFIMHIEALTGVEAPPDRELRAGTING
jgi:hypothetical protein